MRKIGALEYMIEILEQCLESSSFSAKLHANLTELLRKYFLGILTTDSHGNFTVIFKKFLKMATVISKNTFFSRTSPVAASVKTQN